MQDLLTDVTSSETEMVFDVSDTNQFGMLAIEKLISDIWNGLTCKFK